MRAILEFILWILFGLISFGAIVATFLLASPWS
jgi:hypothetical protein